MTNDFTAWRRARRGRPDDVQERPRHLLRGLTIAALALASTERAHAQSPAYPAAEWRWTGAMRGGGTIEIRLVRGSVRAETIPGQEATVVLIRRGDRSDPTTARLSVDTAGGDFRIADRYPAANATVSREDCLPALDTRGDFWHSDVRVDAVVRIPPGARLIVRVMDGDIDVRPLSGPRDVVTNQGAVLGEAYRP
jgi:hypothetical protein